ncbi:MAG: hypothetical protein AAF788_02400 [Pseudomonadota bacterium]
MRIFASVLDHWPWNPLRGKTASIFTLGEFAMHGTNAASDAFRQTVRGRLIVVACLLVGGLLAAILLGTVMDGPLPIIVAALAWIGAIVSLLMFLWRQVRPAVDDDPNT